MEKRNTYLTSVGPDWAVCWLVANCTNNQQGLPLTCATLPPLSHPGWWSKHIRKVDNFYLPPPGPHISATTKPGKEIRWQLICVDQEITADRQGQGREPGRKFLSCCENLMDVILTQSVNYVNNHKLEHRHRAGRGWHGSGTNGTFL